MDASLQVVYSKDLMIAACSFYTHVILMLDVYVCRESVCRLYRVESRRLQKRPRG